MDDRLFSLHRLQDFVLQPVLFMLCMAGIEALYYRFAMRKSFDWKTGLITTPIAAGEFTMWMVLVYYMTAAAPKLQSFSLVQWRIESPTMDWLLYLLAADFVFYLGHYTSHRLAWFWADHSVHHTSTSVSLFAGNRNGWTGIIAGMWLFTLPFVFLGFDWFKLISGLNVILLYQFFIHTEVIRKLGVFEYVFNTPSRHRVHHGMNPEYLNKNFGGMFLLYDWLFGTLGKELPGVQPVYGYKGQPKSSNPFVLLAHGWISLWPATSARENVDKPAPTSENQAS